MERFDGFYTEIAKESGSIENLIESFMSFLLRRTDFFYEADPGDKMGFPPGVCGSMMASIFKKYQDEYYKKHPKKSSEGYNKKLEDLKKKKQEDVKREIKSVGSVKAIVTEVAKSPLDPKISQSNLEQPQLIKNNEQKQQHQNDKKPISTTTNSKPEVSDIRKIN